MPGRRFPVRPRMHRSLVRRGQAGGVLPAVIILSSAVLILVLTTFHIGAMEATLVVHGVSRSQTLYIAEGGLSKGQSYLESLEEPPALADTLYPFGEDVGEFADGRELVWITPGAVGGGASGSLMLVSEATVGGHTRRLEAIVKPGVFSDFLYFTDTEHMPGSGNPLWFCTGDVVEGPMFTNDQISIFGDPQFMSGVASAYGGPDDNNQNHNAALYYYNDSPTEHIESTELDNAPYDNPYFSEGCQLGSEHIIYPRLPSVFEFRAAARSGGIDLAGSYDIVLGRDPGTGPMLGYVSYRKPGRRWTDVEISSTNGILFVNGGVTVQGVLDGRLTIITNGTIDIVDDVRYLASNEDGPLPDCDDMLGLVSGADIVITNNAANCDDCVIHAAMITLCNSFLASNWNTGDPRGNLTVWGSIVQSFRGSVGTGALVDGVPTVITGYAKDYHYDWRLQDEYPPGFYRFLKTGSYKRLAWREIPQAELGNTPTAS